jgi:hypothetical protein
MEMLPLRCHPVNGDDGERIELRRTPPS